ncbi:MAG: NAD-dependent epimerase/dehydratase family protein [Anaerolineaceae bacterium]|nr:NAD-dependent epimerase/dehydratase family protein [Anaerolineaceae bacterium]
MRVLIIGGTRFLGRALVHSAQARGHELTLFNRGKSNPGLFPEIEQISGERMADLDLLRGRQWDAVIDTCGYEPAAVRLSATSLSGAVERYIFISSISVYADLSRPGVDETAATAALPKGAGEQFNIEHYGALKALCEQAAEKVMPGRVLNIRPGLIVGEYDPTDRFTYWPWRAAQGGDILAPGRPEHPIQFIDVRDLADWTVKMIERKEKGIYNATGPQAPVSLGSLLETSIRLSRSGAQLHWASEAFLLENGVQPWSELPLWIPENDPENGGMEQVNVQKAIQAGLSFRTLEDTVQSTLDWANTRPADHAWRAGLTRGKEAELLTKMR